MTIEEINRLYNMRLLGVRAMARDLFVLGCHTAMRYSDYSKLSMAHISKGNIVYKTQKTDTTVIIPAHPRVIEILERWQGSAPPVSLTSLNKIIKQVCQELGIFDDLIPIKEGRTVRYMERYNFISTHTARRSGATNMYLAGIPAQSIMKITGHTTEASFMKYLRITKEQNAKLLAENDFFKK
jgi:integrase